MKHLKKWIVIVCFSFLLLMLHFLSVCPIDHWMNESSVWIQKRTVEYVAVVGIERERKSRNIEMEYLTTFDRYIDHVFLCALLGNSVARLLCAHTHTHRLLYYIIVDGLVGVLEAFNKQQHFMCVWIIIMRTKHINATVCSNWHRQWMNPKWKKKTHRPNNYHIQNTS